VYKYGLVCCVFTGPSRVTSSDLWQMAWELHSSRIVMLANLIEDGRVSVLHGGTKIITNEPEYQPLCVVETVTTVLLLVTLLTAL